jgi:hypothetical protein
MENHGIRMKGKYFIEEVSAPAAGATNEKRLAYNVSPSINGATDQFGQFKMFFHNNSKWLRPLCGNLNDGPDIDNARQLGLLNYRFSKIYSVNFYGAVRYS